MESKANQEKKPPSNSNILNDSMTNKNENAFPNSNPVSQQLLSIPSEALQISIGGMMVKESWLKPMSAQNDDVTSMLIWAFDAAADAKILRESQMKLDSIQQMSGSQAQTPQSQQMMQIAMTSAKNGAESRNRLLELRQLDLNKDLNEFKRPRRQNQFNIVTKYVITEGQSYVLQKHRPSVLMRQAKQVLDVLQVQSTKSNKQNQLIEMQQYHFIPQHNKQATPANPISEADLDQIARSKHLFVVTASNQTGEHVVTWPEKKSPFRVLLIPKTLKQFINSSGYLDLMVISNHLEQIYVIYLNSIGSLHRMLNFQFIFSKKQLLFSKHGSSITNKSYVDSSQFFAKTARIFKANLAQTFKQYLVKAFPIKNISKSIPPQPIYGNMLKPTDGKQDQIKGLKDTTIQNQKQLPSQQGSSQRLLGEIPEQKHLESNETEEDTFRNPSKMTASPSDSKQKLAINPVAATAAAASVVPIANTSNSIQNDALKKPKSKSLDEDDFIVTQEMPANLSQRNNFENSTRQIHPNQLNVQIPSNSSSMRSLSPVPIMAASKLLADSGAKSLGNLNEPISGMEKNKEGDLNLSSMSAKQQPINQSILFDSPSSISRTQLPQQYDSGSESKKNNAFKLNLVPISSVAGAVAPGTTAAMVANSSSSVAQNPKQLATSSYAIDTPTPKSMLMTPDGVATATGSSSLSSVSMSKQQNVSDLGKSSINNLKNGNQPNPFLSGTGANASVSAPQVDLKSGMNKQFQVPQQDELLLQDPQAQQQNLKNNLSSEYNRPSLNQSFQTYESPMKESAQLSNGQPSKSVAGLTSSIQSNQNTNNILENTSSLKPFQQNQSSNNLNSSHSPNKIINSSNSNRSSISIPSRNQALNPYEESSKFSTESKGVVGASSSQNPSDFSGMNRISRVQLFFYFSPSNVSSEAALLSSQFEENLLREMVYLQLNGTRISLQNSKSQSMRSKQTQKHILAVHVAIPIPQDEQEKINANKQWVISLLNQSSETILVGSILLADSQVSKVSYGKDVFLSLHLTQAISGKIAQLLQSQNQLNYSAVSELQSSLTISAVAQLSIDNTIEPFNTGYLSSITRLIQAEERFLYYLIPFKTVSNKKCWTIYPNETGISAKQSFIGNQIDSEIERVKRELEERSEERVAMILEWQGHMQAQMLVDLLERERFEALGDLSRVIDWAQFRGIPSMYRLCVYASMVDVTVEQAFAIKQIEDIFSFKAVEAAREGNRNGSLSVRGQSPVHRQAATAQGYGQGIDNSNSNRSNQSMTASALLRVFSQRFCNPQLVSAAYIVKEFCASEGASTEAKEFLMSTLRAYLMYEQISSVNIAQSSLQSLYVAVSSASLKIILNFYEQFRYDEAVVIRFMQTQLPSRDKNNNNKSPSKSPSATQSNQSQPTQQSLNLQQLSQQIRIPLQSKKPLKSHFKDDHFFVLIHALKYVQSIDPSFVYWALRHRLCSNAPLLHESIQNAGADCAIYSIVYSGSHSFFANILTGQMWNRVLDYFYVVFGKKSDRIEGNLFMLSIALAVFITFFEESVYWNAGVLNSQKQYQQSQQQKQGSSGEKNRSLWNEGARLIQLMHAFYATYLDFDGFFKRLREILAVEEMGNTRTIAAYKAHLLEAKELDELLTSNSRAQQQKSISISNGNNAQSSSSTNNGGNSAASRQAQQQQQSNQPSLTPIEFEIGSLLRAKTAIEQRMQREFLLIDIVIHLEMLPEELANSSSNASVSIKIESEENPACLDFPIWKQFRQQQQQQQQSQSASSRLSGRQQQPILVPICVQVPYPSMSVNTGDEFLVITIRQSPQQTQQQSQFNQSLSQKNVGGNNSMMSHKQSMFVGRVYWEPVLNLNKKINVILFDAIGQSAASSAAGGQQYGNSDNSRLNSSNFGTIISQIGKDVRPICLDATNHVTVSVHMSLTSMHSVNNSNESQNISSSSFGTNNNNLNLPGMASQIQDKQQLVALQIQSASQLPVMEVIRSRLNLGAQASLEGSLALLSPYDFKANSLHYLHSSLQVNSMYANGNGGLSLMQYQQNRVQSNVGGVLSSVNVWMKNIAEIVSSATHTSLAAKIRSLYLILQAAFSETVHLKGFAVFALEILKMQRMHTINFEGLLREISRLLDDPSVIKDLKVEVNWVSNGSVGGGQSQVIVSKALPSPMEMTNAYQCVLQEVLDEAQDQIDVRAIIQRVHGNHAISSKLEKLVGDFKYRLRIFEECNSVGLQANSYEFLVDMNGNIELDSKNNRGLSAAGTKLMQQLAIMMNANVVVFSNITLSGKCFESLVLSMPWMVDYLLRSSIEQVFFTRQPPLLLSVSIFDQNQMESEWKDLETFDLLDDVKMIVRELLGKSKYESVESILCFYVDSNGNAEIDVDESLLNQIDIRKAKMQNEFVRVQLQVSVIFAPTAEKQNLSRNPSKSGLVGGNRSGIGGGANLNGDPNRSQLMTSNLLRVADEYQGDLTEEDELNYMSRVSSAQQLSMIHPLEKGKIDAVVFAPISNGKKVVGLKKVQGYQDRYILDKQEYYIPSSHLFKL